MAREKVAYIKVVEIPGDNSGWVQTKNGKTYILWWPLVWPESTSASCIVMHSHWISLLKDATVNNWDVEFMTEKSTSNKVVNIKVYAP